MTVGGMTPRVRPTSKEILTSILCTDVNRSRIRNGGCLLLIHLSENLQWLAQVRVEQPGVTG